MLADLYLRHQTVDVMPGVRKEKGKLLLSSHCIMGTNIQALLLHHVSAAASSISQRSEKEQRKTEGQAKTTGTISWLIQKNIPEQQIKKKKRMKERQEKQIIYLDALVYVFQMYLLMYLLTGVFLLNKYNIQVGMRLGH